MAAVINEVYVVSVYEEGEFIGYVDKYNDLTTNEDKAYINTYKEAEERQKEAKDTYPDCLVMIDSRYIE